MPTPRPKPTPLQPKQEVIPIMREVLGRVEKAEDLEVHVCRASMAGVTVLDIRDYVPSLDTYGRGTTLPWNRQSLATVRAALANAKVARDA